MGVWITGELPAAEMARFSHRSTDFVLRLFAYEGRIHAYRKRDLADPAVQWPVPWCGEDSAYPDRHPRSEVVLPGGLGPGTSACPTCLPGWGGR